MSITLTNGATTVELDPDLLWSDEFEWNAVRQSVDRGITGALIVQSASLISGRPITLEPEDDLSGWMTRSQVEQLAEWSAISGLALTLNLRGVDRTVGFRHEDGTPGLSARPVVHFDSVEPGDQYLVTLRFMEL